MSKSVAKFWKVVVNGVNLSRCADDVDTPLEKEQIDVSGFGGTREFIPGIEDGTLTIEFLQGYGAGEPHNVIYPLYAAGTTFPVYVQPDSTAGTGTTNPIFGGTASVYQYDGGQATLNDAQKFSVDFKPAPNSSFTWGTVAP